MLLLHQKLIKSNGELLQNPLSSDGNGEALGIGEKIDLKSTNFIDISDSKRK